MDQEGEWGLCAVVARVWGVGRGYVGGDWAGLGARWPAGPRPSWGVFLLFYFFINFLFIISFLFSLIS